MAQRQALRELPPFSRKVDAPFAVHAHVSVTGHALQRGGHRRRSHIQFFSKARADGRLIFFQHLPYSLEIVFLRNAGFVPPQIFSSLSAGYERSRPVVPSLPSWVAANSLRNRCARSATRRRTASYVP